MDLIPQSIAEFVMLDGGTPVTDSRRVARHFGKQHWHVLRDIRSLIAQAGPVFAESNFGFCTDASVAQRGKPLPFYRMTKDGFMLLVMGFAGRKAMQVKLAFLAAFNAMAEALHSGTWQRAQLAQAALDEQDRIGSFHGKGLWEHKVRKPPLRRELDEAVWHLQLSLLGA